MKKHAAKIPPKPAAAPAPREGWRRWPASPMFIGLLLAAVTAALYWPVTGFEILYYDDGNYFSNNHHVLGGLTAQNVAWAFSTIDVSSWYPLTWLSFMLDAQLFGPGPAGPHFTNMLFHVVNTVLLFLWLRGITAATWRSALVAAWFALHPLHVESVAWISERKDVLSTFFGFLSLIFYTRYAKPAAASRQSQAANYALAILCFAGSLLAKPMLVTMPFLLLLLDCWPLQRISNFGFQVSNPRTPKAKHETQKLWRLLLEKIPFLLVGVAAGMVTLLVHKSTGAINPLATAPLGERLANALVSYARYLGKTFWPVHLALPYPYPGPWPVALVMFAAALVAGLCLAAVWCLWRRPAWFVGWFWFFGALLPVIGLVQWGDHAMADRFTYVPLVGLFIVLAWMLGELAARSPAVRMAVIVLAVGSLAACAARTRDQLLLWRNSETFFNHTLAVTRDNYIAMNNLGAYLEGQKRTDEAIVLYRRALKINPGYADAMNSLGSALTTQSNYAGAIVLYRELLKLDPGHADAHYNYGCALADTGRYAEAVDEYQEALKLQPDFPPAYNNLGIALTAVGRLDDARVEYEAALKLKPDFTEARNNLAYLLLTGGRVAEAVAQYEESLRIKPAQPKAHFNLGNAYAIQERYAEAAAQFQEAVRLDPGYAVAHKNLGMALARLGKPVAAESEFHLAAKINPGLPDVHDDLGNLLAEEGRFAAAEAEFREAVRCQPDSADTRFNLGNTLALQGKLSDAIQQYAEALRLQPDYAQAQLNWGSALARLGRKDEAVIHLREALRLKPDYEEARQQLKEIDPAASP
jgi:tetratricopeptide (TPR) repeat protein